MTDLYIPFVAHRVSYPNVEATDVEVCGDYVFVSFDNQTVRDKGFVNVYRMYDRSSMEFSLLHNIVGKDLHHCFYCFCSNKYCYCHQQKCPIKTLEILHSCC